jgi:hypothetical protein
MRLSGVSFTASRKDVEGPGAKLPSAMYQAAQELERRRPVASFTERVTYNRE